MWDTSQLLALGSSGKSGFLHDPPHFHTLTSTSSPLGALVVPSSITHWPSPHHLTGVPCQLHDTDPKTITVGQRPSPAWVDSMGRGYPHGGACRERPGACRVGGSLSWSSRFLFLFFLFKDFILFLERGKREGGRRRENINVWLPLACPYWGPGLQPRHVP